MSNQVVITPGRKPDCPAGALLQTSDAEPNLLFLKWTAPLGFDGITYDVFLKNGNSKQKACSFKRQKGREEQPSCVFRRKVLENAPFYIQEGDEVEVIVVATNYFGSSQDCPVTKFKLAWPV
jgi:hypothetical protein